MPRFNDLTGHVYNYLTVLRMGERIKNGNIRWVCQCKCGRETLVLAGALRNGNVKSCGCYGNPKFDITNQRFGRLTALERVGQKWVCRCDCGTNVLIRRDCLVRDVTHSCGCLADEVMKKHGHASNGTTSKEYRAWGAMRERCVNPNNKRYADYGGRGIAVCDEWLDFNTFFADIGAAPTAHHSLDRIDNDKGYCKENCKWSTSGEQMRNRRLNVCISVDGLEFKSVPALAEHFGLSAGVVASRVKRGWVGRDLVRPPSHVKRVGQK